MKAQRVRIKRNGPAETLALEEFQLDDNLAPDDVLIQTAYSGLNYADILMRLGLYQDAPKKPFTPGYEVSGTVLKVGSNVTRVKAGDQIVAGTLFGGYASHIKTSEKFCLPLPSGLDLAQGAALPVNGITTLLALDDFGRVRAGDKVLIQGASGGVGTLAVQFALEKGCEVWGTTTSPHKKAFIEQMGAKAMTEEEVLGLKSDKFDFILNSAAGPKLHQYYKLLKKSGKLVCIGIQDAVTDGKRNYFKLIKTLLGTKRYSIFDLLMESKSVGGFNALKYFTDDLEVERLIGAMGETSFQPHVGKVFPSKEVGQAHSFLESKQAKGKVLISWQN